MNATPGPTELEATINPERHVEEVRSLFCDGYDTCLEEALRQDWASWTCVGCPMFVRAEPRLIDRFAECHVQ